MPTIIEGIKLYTIPEAAKALKVSPGTIRNMLKEGRLKGHRIGRPVFITKKQITAFLEPIKDEKNIRTKGRGPGKKGITLRE